jgi:formate hydrogenlyase transcriptional activator
MRFRLPTVMLNTSSNFAPTYEMLFRVTDCLRTHRDIEGLLRDLPSQLRSVLHFDCVSVYLRKGSGNGASWYVINEDNPPVLTPTRKAPLEEAQLSWAFEHQQPTVIPSGPDRQFSGCAVPLTTSDRRLGAIFLGTESPAPGTEEEVRFLTFVAGRIALLIENILTNHIYVENLSLREEVALTSMFEEIVGSSDALTHVLSQVKKVAPADATVLISGESGTGKELIARAIHKGSDRSRQPFVRVNCAAIPPSLIASELFGYERGAFTGATQRHLGRFEVANGGTIFLDEIGDIPPETQIALLRVLQEREFERVGSNHPIPVDVRVIAATNGDLRAAVNEGKFRLDLFYRLNVFPIQVPSLRERPEDIILLAKYFIDRYASKSGKKIHAIERRTLDRLQGYDWPGNIRELQNVVERAVILCEGATLSIEDAWLQTETPRRSKQPVILGPALVKQEREIIEAALEESRGRISGPFGAAGKLGLPRTTLESKIKTLCINKHRFHFAAR